MTFYSSRISLITALFICLSSAVFSQTTTLVKTFNSISNVEFGAGVTSVNVSMWGGGGGGSAGGMKQYTNSTDYILHYGAGGGGSSWAGTAVTVIPNHAYLVEVGTGGYGGGFDGDNNPQSGGNGTASTFQGVTSYGGFGGTVSGFNAYGGARSANPTPDPGVGYAEKGDDEFTTQGGDGGLSNAGTYGVSGPNYNGWSGLGYPHVPGIGTGGPGTRPGDGGGGGGYTVLPFPFTNFLAERKAGGRGADGMVRFYVTYPTYKFTAPPIATKVCGSGAAVIRLRSNSLSAGYYRITYNTTNPVTIGNVADFTFNAAFGSGTFTTIPLSASSTITVTNIASGTICTDAVTQFNSVNVVVENTTANDWNPQIAFGGTGRSNAVSFSIGDKGYIGTGKNGSTLLNDFWEFNQATNSWTQLANFGGGVRADAVGLAIGTKGYIGTGSDGTNDKNDFWEYDPFTNVWTAKAAFLGVPRSGATGMTIGNKGYIGTGFSGTIYFNDFMEYNPQTNSWTVKTVFGGGIAGTGRIAATAFSIGNKGYMGMGYNNSVYCKDLWEYNPATNAWVSKTAFGGVARSGAVGWSIGSKGYVGTGWNGTAGLNDFYEYDPSFNTWTLKAAFGGAARRLASGFSIGNKGYIGLGTAGSVYYNDFFEFSAVNTTLVTGALSATSYCAGTAVSVPFTIGCLAFNGGNIFTAQLSDSLGNFTNSTSIGSLASSGAGSIAATIPANAVSGPKYRIRVVASNPATVGTDNGANIGIRTAAGSTVTAGISNASICRAESINLSATVSTTSLNDTTVILSENFNTGAPSWLMTNSNSYQFGNTGIYTNGQSGFHSNDNSSFYVTSSSGRFSTDVTNTTLQSPVFSTLGMNSGILTFYHHYLYGNYNQADSIRVQASVDQGASWSTVYLNNTVTVGDPQDSLGFVKQTVSLNNFMNQPSLVLRFNYGALGGLGRWMIDNIVVRGVSKTNNFSWTSNPAGFTSAVQNPTGVVPTLVGAPSTYTVTFSNNFGCGVLSNSVSVFVKDTSSSITTLSICPSELPYTWNGLVFNGAGTQIKHLINAVGCDSAAKLILIVKPISVSSTTILICPTGLPYTWNGLVFNAGGAQTAHFTNSVGCDSAATLNLVIKPVSSYTTNLSICQTALPYSWNGLTFNAAGSQTAHFTNSVGCDSAVTLNLVTTPAALTAAANLTSVCPGAVVSLSSTGNSGGAVTVLNEKFNSTHNNWTTMNLGSGGLVDSAAWTLRPNNYEPYFGLPAFTSNDNSGFYHTSSYAQGQGVTTHTILQSPPFSTVGLTSASMSLNHQFSHQTNFSTDSIRVQVSSNGTTWTNLYVNKTASVGSPSDFQPLTISLAAYLNVPALRLRFVYNATPIGGYYNYWWAIDNVNVTGTLAPNTYAWTSVPAGFTSAVQNPAPFTPTQTAVYNVSANNGFCSSSASVNVVVNVTNPVSTTNISICPSSLPYTWNGLTFNAGGTQIAHINTAGGCDSSTTLNLTVKAASSSVTNIIICPSGLPYTWNGFVFNAAGSQTKHLTNSVGCDSAAVLNLTVQTSSSSSSTNITICENQLPYTWNGLTFTGSGSQTKMLTNSFGCDSAATLTLFVSIKPANLVAGISAATVCAGTPINLTASSTAGTAILNENFNSGAPGWTKQNLSTGGNAAAAAWTLRPDGYLFIGAVALHSNDNSSFYISDSYTQGSGGTTNTILQSPSFSTAGYSAASLSFNHVFANRDANDSARVQISSNGGSTWNTIYVTRQFQGGYTNFVLQTVSLNAYLNMPSLMLRFNYGAANDFMWSIDNVKVTGTAAAPAYSWSSVPAGFTSSLQNPTGIIPTQSATYKLVATNASGCSDSTLVAVTVKPVSTSFNSISVCQSAIPYTWNGLTFNTAGTQIAHLPNSVGCDSAASLTLSVRALSVSATTLAVCQSAIPYNWNGLTFNAAGTQTAHLLNSAGCDSAATLTLTINPSPGSLTVNASNTSVCAGTAINLTSAATSGATAVLFNANFNAPTDSWIKTNTTTGGNSSVSSWALRPHGSSSISSNDNSQYYMSSNAQLDYGKQIHVTLQSPTFSTVGVATASLSFYHVYWHNPNDWDSIRVQVSPDGVNWNTVYLNNSTDVGFVNYNATFMQQTVSLNAYVNQPNLRLRFNYNAEWGGNFWGVDNVSVTGNPLNTYSWTSTPAGFTSNQQNPSGIVPSQTTTYTVAATNPGGCVATGSITVAIKQVTSSVTDSSICTDALPFTWNGLTFTGAGTQTVHLLNAAGCDSSATLNLTIRTGKSWIGGNGNWSVPANWCGGLPNNGDTIFIASGHPKMDIDFMVRGSLTISGSGALTINPLMTLTVAGTADFGGKPVTIRSDSTGSGSIGTITGVLNNATNVTVQRYIPNYGFPSWSMLSVPTYASGQTIRQAWQEGIVNPNPFNNNLGGFGTLIFNTGTTAAAQAAGFDDANASASLLKYNGTAFQAVSTTNTAIATKEGYMVLVRGDRSVGVSTLQSTATILRTTGTIYQGYQTTATIPANSFGLVGNPYPSAINFTSLGRAGGASDVFYLWDPKKIVGSNAGVYQTFSATNGYEGLISGGNYQVSSPNTVIQSGQAFFTETRSEYGSVTIPEESKLPGNGAVVYSPVSLVKLESRLYRTGGTNAGMADANVVVFSSAYSNAVNGEDASKLNNPGENFGIRQSAKTLTVEGRQPIATADTIFFNMTNLQTQNYRFEFVPRNMLAQNVSAILEDTWLNTGTPVPMADTSRINFTVDASPGSYATNRFRIVFSRATNNCFGTSRSFSAASAGATYQWQANSGSGYNNITDGGIYSGTGTATLKLTGVPTSYTGYKYRSLVNGIPGPENMLRFELTWTGAVSTDWALSDNWSCGVLPDEYTDVVIPAGMPNYPIVTVSTAVRKLTTMPGTVITVGSGVNFDIKGK